ncbi:hypothetical protein PPERSA_06998 [Pseudocohnilembus persalinus]|uniref:Transmembrane protein n=1 Tax=Pseudocohnilembus persalinus TaxID=266149 RepID=A0A0V0QYJ4_PSEPJ|nr:hypothetical protein PPERSA_06998 [Pseudocohnilembus persalinus]|eukprot:KRX07383.1 hypothetical protein PPERSA_06998 [Pseudocohnilembus persalinus]
MFGIQYCFDYELGQLSFFLLSFLNDYPLMKLIFVMSIVPTFLNMLLFWTQDNFLQKKDRDPEEEYDAQVILSKNVSYHKSGTIEMQKLEPNNEEEIIVQELINGEEVQKDEKSYQISNQNEILSNNNLQISNKTNLNLINEKNVKKKSNSNNNSENTSLYEKQQYILKEKQDPNNIQNQNYNNSNNVKTQNTQKQSSSNAQQVSTISTNQNFNNNINHQIQIQID